MIKDQEVQIKVFKNIKYYKSIYKNLKYGDIINIKIKYLLNGSHIKIIGTCDFCSGDKYISYKDYNRQTNNNSEKFACSKKCSVLKTKVTNIVKYGVENVFQSDIIKDKIKNTNLAKWGFDNPNKNYLIRDKIKSTNLQKFGYESYSKTEEFTINVKKSNNIKFGVDYPFKSEEIRNTFKEYCIDKFGVDNFSKTDIFKDKQKNNYFNKAKKRLEKFGTLISMGDGFILNCNNCGGSFHILSSLLYTRSSSSDVICTICNPKNKYISQGYLFDFIKGNYNGDILENYRNIDGKELDIYIPDLNLAFEFNGLYWHSELYKVKNYHLDKTRLCFEKGIQLIHIWEDDWLYKQSIIKSMILNKIGKSSNKIYARKCIIKEINDNKVIRKFLDINHIQGFVGSTIKLGLYYNNELVSLMTFGNLRKSLGQKKEEGSYELIRFCNILDTNVVGGASKLFKYFLNKYNAINVISYSDLSRSVGNMYMKLGFNLSHNSIPNYYYIIDGIRKHRFNYRKDKLIKEGYDKLKTEIQIMNDRNYYRIFDCGMQKWIFKNK